MGKSLQQLSPQQLLQQIEGLKKEVRASKISKKERAYRPEKIDVIKNLREQREAVEADIEAIRLKREIKKLKTTRFLMKLGFKK